MLKTIPFITIIIATLLSMHVTAQDERHFRELFKSDLQRYRERMKTFEPGSWTTNTDAYEVDFNQDGLTESFVVEKTDGVDRFHIYNAFNKRLFSYEFDTLGRHSHLYKINLRRISSETIVAILFFYEGYAKYLDFNSTSRLYFLTVDRGRLTTMSVYKGPAYWEEFKDMRGHYHQRNYLMALKDFNHDGIREILVKHHDAISVYKYLGNGKWQENGELF